MFFAPAAWAWTIIVVAAVCPRLGRKVALAASTLMALSCVGVKPRTSEPQNTAAFEPVRVRLRVCAPAFRSCLARFVRLAALAKRPLTTRARRRLPSCKSAPTLRAELFVDPQFLQLPRKNLRALARAPPMPADVSVDKHELLLTTFWKQCLTQACPRSHCVARNKWYSEDTWTQIVLARQKRERFF